MSRSTFRTPVRGVIGSLVLLIATAGIAIAHDLFLRIDEYYARPDSDVPIQVLNGTFSKSEGAVTRDRVRSLDVATPSGMVKLDTTAWRPHGDTTLYMVHAGQPGTYVAGASILPRSISLTAKDFNTYLAGDGVPDVLAQRRRDHALDRPARELYQKHVKAIFQVGSTHSTGFDRAFGYPAELVPLDNPYAIRVGATLRVRAIVDGTPVANQYVVSGGRTRSGARITARGVRTDSLGIARIPLRASGVWYVKFIHMVPAPPGDSVNYHSKWATLTFAVGSSPR